jgi:hypothetical protein
MFAPYNSFELTMYLFIFINNSFNSFIETLLKAVLIIVDKYDYQKRITKLAVSFNLDGQALTFPDWASEATAEQMLDILKTMAKQSGASQKDQAKATDSAKRVLAEIKKGNDSSGQSDDEQKKRDETLLKETKAFGKDIREVGKSLEQYKMDKEFDASFLGTLKNSFESEGENVGKAIMVTAEHMYKGAAYIGGAVMQYGSALGQSILGAGESLNDLSKVGVGFNETYQGMAESAGLGVSQLAGLTGSFAGAADLIGKNSKVVATQGFEKFSATMREAADISEELGLSLEDSLGAFGESLNRRQRFMDVGNVNQSRMNSQIAKTTKMQMAYATAIGVSTEEMAAFVESLFDNTEALTASLIGFSDTVRSDVTAGIEVFASGLAGMGGKAGQDIAAAFLDAGSKGAIGMSDAATGFVRALPSLAGPMNEFADAMQAGTLTQEQSKDMVNSLTSQLGNLSAGEKDRVFQMARIGDASAQQMAQAITQFEQSEDALKEVNKKFGTAFDMDTVQKGTNQFNKIMTNITGGASNAFYSLFADPEIMKVIEEGMSDIFKLFGMGIDDLSGSAMNAGDMVKSMVPAVKSFVGFIVDIGKDIAGFFAKFKTDEGFDFGGMIDGLIGKATGLLFKGLATFVGVWLGATWATHYAKTILGPRILTFAKGMFAKHGPAAMQLAKNALNYSKGMFAQGATAGKNILNNSIAYAKNVFNSSGAKGVASKMSGYASTYGKAIFSGGKDLAGKIAGMASGFMGKLTKGGAPDVVGKGVSKAGGLVSSLGAKAKALVPKGVSDKVSNMGGKVSGMLKGASDNADKATMPMGKSGGFMQSIADAVKKFGDSKVLKGAAAIALLGASVGLAGVGLKQFNEVNFTSLIKGTLALGGLAALAQVLGKGSTAMIKGAAAILLLGTAVVPLAFGLNLMKDVGLGTIGVLAAGLITLGAAAAILSFASPFIITGSVAIAALGLALIPFGIALNLVANALPAFTDSMAKMAEVDGMGLLKASGGMLAMGGAMALMAPLLPFMMLGALAAPSIRALGESLLVMNLVDFNNLSMAGEALAALGAGMAAMSGGSLMSSISDGIGSLFGADSPVDKLKVFISELSNLDIGPLLSTAYAFDLLLTSSDRLQEFGTNLAVVSMYTEPFVEQMYSLSNSLLLMGKDPFEPFNTLGTHAEGMTMFATSAEQLTAALDNIDYGYISTGFYDIADSVEAVADSMSQISMGDMLKMGAMKLIGPSKEERKEEDQQIAVKSHATDKLFGEHLGGGLQRVMDNITLKDGDTLNGVQGGDPRRQILNQQAELAGAGIGVDITKLHSKELGVAATEMQRITGLLQSQIDMYSMQKKTGVVADNVPTTAQPLAEVTEATKPQNTTTPPPVVEKDAMSGNIGAGMSQEELLAELVRLTQINTNLLKKGNRITEAIEV